MDWWRVGRMVSVGVALMGLWLAVAIVVAGSNPVSGDGPSFVDADEFVIDLDAVSPVAVRVHSQVCGSTVSGSGFVVGDRLYTNRHVVQEAEVLSISVVSTPQVAVDIPVLDRSERLDLAVAGPVPEALAADTVDFAENDAAVGESVRVEGWVDGRLQRRDATVHLYTDGRAYGVDGPVMLIDPATTFGYSGGPVLNVDGEVVGMLQSVDLVTSLTLAIPVSELRDADIKEGRTNTSTSC